MGAGTVWPMDANRGRAPYDMKHDALGSVLIAANNEESKIGACLTALLGQARVGEFEVVVVCNGCHDDTADVAKRAAAELQHSLSVVETPQPGKAGALNLGDDCLTCFPRIYLDADIELSTSAARGLVSELAKPEVRAATVAADLRVEEASSLVRRHYRARARVPYAGHLVGRGVYALSGAGRARFDRFPDRLGDDLFVQSLFDEDECSTLAAFAVVVHPPQSLREFLRAQTRIAVGNLQHRREHPGPGPPDVPTVERGAEPTRLRSVLAAHDRPSSWADLAAFLALTAVVRARARWRLYRADGLGSWTTSR